MQQENSNYGQPKGRLGPSLDQAVAAIIQKIGLDVFLFGNSNRKDVDVLVIGQDECQFDQVIQFLFSSIDKLRSEINLPIIFFHHHSLFSPSKEYIHYVFYPDYSSFFNYEDKEIVASISRKCPEVRSQTFPGEVNKFQKSKMHLAQAAMLACYIRYENHELKINEENTVERIIYHLRYSILSNPNNIFSTNSIDHWDDFLSEYAEKYGMDDYYFIFRDRLDDKILDISKRIEEIILFFASKLVD